MTEKNSALLKAAVAGLVGIVAVAAPAMAKGKAKAKTMKAAVEGCSFAGVANGCKGQNACKGGGHECKGMGSCKGTGLALLHVQKGECAANGGTVHP